MKVDVAVIGAGYYGCAIATEIRDARPGLSVAVVERDSKPFARASSTNQGQLHAGYMYGAFPELARECRQGAEEFARSYADAVNQGVQTYYGVHQDSDMSAAEYEAFCRGVGLRLEPVATPSGEFFNPALARVYRTAEKTFDNAVLHNLVFARLMASGAELITSFPVTKVRPTATGFDLECADGRRIHARTVLNAGFADSNELHAQSGIRKLPLDHAVFLHFLVKLPSEHRMTGLITVRGPYAALTPASGGTEASHVLASGRFRVARVRRPDAPSEKLTADEIAVRYAQAVAEASSYMPALREAELVGHTIGTRTNYIDPATGLASSQAVLLPDYDGIPGYHCVIGGKVTCLPGVLDPIRQLARRI